MGSAGPMQNFINWIVAKDIDEDEEMTESKSSANNNSSVSSQNRRQETIAGSPKLRAIRTEQTMQIFHPRSLEEREKVADGIKNRGYVTLDLTKLTDSATRKSFFEFICGVVHGLDANISPITDGVYSIMPFGMEISIDNMFTHSAKLTFYGRKRGLGVN